MKQLQNVKVARMRQLANYLETVTPDQFDLSRWESEAYVPARTLLWGLIEIQPACGFVGCAMGWAAHSKLFPGLAITANGVLYYKGSSAFHAAAKVFNISIRSAEFLFTPEMYKDGDFTEPGVVADRLNRYADKVESRRNRDRFTPKPTKPKLELVAA